MPNTANLPDEDYVPVIRDGDRYEGARWTDPLDYPGGETIEFTGEAPPVLAIPSSRGTLITEADTPESIARKLDEALAVLYRQ